MHFATFGKKKKSVLVILHGWGLSLKEYVELAKLLAEKFYVVVPEFPGFGQTPPPRRPFNVEDYAKALKKFLDEQEISQAHFIGHSFGGRVLLRLANLYPDLVKTLTLTGCPGIEKFHLKRSAKRAIYWSAAKALRLFTFIPPIKRLRTKFYAHRDLGQVEGIMKQTFLKVIKENLTADARKIQQPTLLLWGNRDQMAPVYDAEKMLKVIPHSHLKIFTKVGHKLPYEKPHEFAREVMQFVAKY